MLRILLGTTALIASGAAWAADATLTDDVRAALAAPSVEVTELAEAARPAENAAVAAQAFPANTADVEELGPALPEPLSVTPRPADGFVFRTSPSPMIPFERGVANQVFVGGVFDDDYAIAKAGGALPIIDENFGQITLFGEGFRAFDLDDGVDVFGGSVGPVWRQRLDGNSAIGANLFVDAGADDDVDDILVQFGAGLEYEEILNLDNVETLRFGVNGYLPLEDYSDVASFGDLDRAPQLGGDAYIRYGVDVNQGMARVDLTLGGFGYAAGDESDELFGGVATLGLTIWDSLPEGMALSGYIGPRYATGGDQFRNGDEDLDVIGGVQLSYSFGGDKLASRQVTTQPRLEAPRDCVIARDNQGRAVYDCTRPVRTGRGGVAKTGEMVREQIPAPQPRTETIQVTLPGAAPVPPIRHIGYGTAFVPVKR